MFRWEPEGRYHSTKSGNGTLLLLKSTSLNGFNALLLWANYIVNVRWEPDWHLKPHVRHQRVTAWGLAVLCWSPWLIPHNMLPNAQNAGSAGKRTPLLGGPSRQSVPNSTWPSELHRSNLHVHHKMHESEFEPYSHTEVVWHISQSPHAIWCSPTLPHRDWLCGWRLNVGNGPMRCPYFRT